MKGLKRSFRVRRRRNFALMEKRRRKGMNLLSQGFSQAEVARRCGVSETTSLRWKRSWIRKGADAWRRGRLGRPPKTQGDRPDSRPGSNDRRTALSPIGLRQGRADTSLRTCQNQDPRTQPSVDSAGWASSQPPANSRNPGSASVSPISAMASQVQKPTSQVRTPGRKRRMA